MSRRGNGLGMLNGLEWRDKMKRLKVHQEKHYLMWEDGTPFFYLGDTAWELFHRLDREEAAEYLERRAAQGFHVVQAAALAELDGIYMGNAYGHRPLVLEEGRVCLPGKQGESFSGTEECEAYWKHVDWVVHRAGELGLFIGILPCWGDKWNKKWGCGPEIFLDSDSAYEYGAWIGERYRGYWNVIWILGGDRPVENEGQESVLDAMAAGIRSRDTGHLMTFHPSGASCSTDFLKCKPYIDFNCCQSGHGLEGYESWKFIRKMQEEEEKPCLDMEPRYEGHPACFQPEYGVFWGEREVRQNGYWNLLQGACGCVYGNHGVWCFCREKDSGHLKTWREGLEEKGAGQMRYMEQLRLCRPFFELRPAPELVEQEEWCGQYIAAARGDKYAFLYTPYGQKMKVHLEKMGDVPVQCSWFDPADGVFKKKEIWPPCPVVLRPPDAGHDWVAVLDF